ncbi:MAG: nucleotidyltransferase domain-containing protein, partial [Acidobacteria bacterium]|nr:nucleotidyltransferase domain-containing protein [Acidobacteriota bacterium]
GEIESIVQKTFGVEVELRAELLKIGQIRYAFLFGSYVKGGFKSDSDIDLFIIGDAENEQVFDAIQKVEGKIGREINYNVSSENEFKEKVRKNFFLQEIVKDFILLKGDESEFKRIVDEAAARGKILN